MNKISLILLLQISGVMHLGLIVANAQMPKTVNLRSHIAPLPTFIRRMFWVYYSFINLCLVGFGLLTITQAKVLASGSELVRAVCLFFAAFWMLRLFAGIFVFEMRPYLTTVPRQLGYSLINVVIVYLLAVYAWAALKNGV